jgi:hypothetical protein
MAERMLYRPQEKGIISKTKEKAVQKTKGVIFWAGEKSTWVTLPTTGVLFVAGAVTAPVALGMAALDVGGSVMFKWMRNKEKQKEGNH